MDLLGKIQSGLGKGAFFTQLDWVVRQCENNLGYKPFPGTLNVYIDTRDHDKLIQLLLKTDFALIPDDPSFCTAHIKKVKVNGIPSAIILPSEEARQHDSHTVEIISFCNLKHSLGLDNDDQVIITIEEKGDDMRIYKEIFEFASSAGALEGYVFSNTNVDLGCLDNWITNLSAQYQDLSFEVRQSFQNSLDRTLGRAVQSLIPILGTDHHNIYKLKTLISGDIPNSPDDFEKEKEKKAQKYGK